MKVTSILNYEHAKGRYTAMAKKDGNKIHLKITKNQRMMTGLFPSEDQVMHIDDEKDLSDLLELLNEMKMIYD